MSGCENMNRFFRSSIVIILATVSFVSCSPNIESITLDQTKISIAPGDVYTLNVAVEPEEAVEDNTLNWESTSPEIAEVIDGVVYAISEGTATITVNISDISSKCIVEVIEPTAYEKLNDDERKFIDWLTNNLGVFKNPGSVKVSDYLLYCEHNGYYFAVDLIAQNGFGGNSSSSYLISEDSIVEEPYGAWMHQTWMVEGSEDNYDIEKINLALQEYYKDMGWS